jgi:hypothetical protein
VAAAAEPTDRLGSSVSITVIEDFGGDAEKPPAVDVDAGADDAESAGRLQRRNPRCTASHDESESIKAAA